VGRESKLQFISLVFEYIQKCFQSVISNSLSRFNDNFSFTQYISATYWSHDCSKFCKFAQENSESKRSKLHAARAMASCLETATPYLQHFYEFCARNFLSR